ncbi:MAG: uracil-DNA glycosylase [Treponema sp.]|nr:uracil-DNA glycosylase [Treponema sp.]
MTKTEKETIYNLLKTAANNAYGYNAPTFAGDMPVFTDDVVVPAEPVPEETGAASETSQNVSFSAQSSDASAPSADIPTSNTVASIAQKIAACQRCALAKTRKNVVPGEGVEKPLVVVVGEGPGQQEDLSGRPFVGPAGELLDKMLASIGLSRTTNTFIANIVKCRPPNNRVPFPDEAAACESFLQAQIFSLKPKMILCAGSTAAKNLLKTQNGVMRLRGSFYEWNGIPVAVTFHPSALLRDTSQKKLAWEDLKMMRARLKEIAPEYNPN